MSWPLYQAFQLTSVLFSELTSIQQNNVFDQAAYSELFDCLALTQKAIKKQKKGREGKNRNETETEPNNVPSIERANGAFVYAKFSLLSPFSLPYHDYI